MKKTRRIILGMLVTTIAIWVFVYGVRAFTIWELENPFQWIINLPTYAWTDRFGILTFLLGYCGVNIMFWSLRQKKMKKAELQK